MYKCSSCYHALIHLYSATATTTTISTTTIQGIESAPHYRTDSKFHIPYPPTNEELLEEATTIYQKWKKVTKMNLSTNWEVDARELLDMTDILGRGTFGVVYKATLHNQTVAVKQIDPSASQISNDM